MARTPSTTWSITVPDGRPTPAWPSTDQCRRTWPSQGWGTDERWGWNRTVSTFVLIHGGGDVGWYWHLVESELRQQGHDVVAPDLPCDDDSADLRAYAD